MSYSEVFGGATLYPSQQTYLALSFAADISLAWPVEQQIAGNDIVADIMDLNATALSLNVDMPDARQASNGVQSVFVNVGANTFTLRTNLGGTIISVAAGEAWVAYLTDNSTQAGTWKTFQLGATVSVANASALAGAGIKAVSTTLNQKIDSVVEASVPFTVVDSDRAKCLISTSGSGVCNLPSPASVGADWFFMLRNQGSGDVTVTPPSGTIDGAATLSFSTGESAFIFTDGTNFFTVGMGGSSTSTFDYISIAIPGSGDFTLSGANLNRIAYRFTGTLTGARKIVVPNTVQEYWVDNSTSGAFALTIGTAAGVSPQVPQGEKAILYSDGTDVINATTSSVTFPIAINQGGTGATTAGGALVNLGAIADTLTLTAAAGLTGGGDLSSNRSFAIGGVTNGGIAINAASIQLDIDDLLAATPVLADEAAFDDSGTSRKATFTVLNSIFIHDNLAGFDADDHVAHSGVDIIAGAGMTGGGNITVSRTLNVIAGDGISVAADAVNLDISGLTAMAVVPVGTDGFLIDDAGTMKRVSYNEIAIPVNTDADTHTFASTDLGTLRVYSGATSTHAWTVNTGLGLIGQAILIANNGGSDGPTITAGTATVESSSGNFVVAQEGVVILIQVASNVWKVSGDLVA